MVRVPTPEALNGYLLKIHFKRWGKLWTPGNLFLRSVPETARLERIDYRMGSLIHLVPLPKLIRRRIAARRYRHKKDTASQALQTQDMPDCFCIECYNPSPEPASLLLTIQAPPGLEAIPYQRLFQIPHGMNIVRIPIAEISAIYDLQKMFEVEITPDGERDDVVLYFGLMEFVKEAPLLSSAVTTKIKCVVWDLDHTLWDGVLLEDGSEKLRMRSGVAEILRSLDERGILLSIASKNNADDALDALRKFGIDSLFLCPQIAWKPKSEAIQTIAKSLNIGLNTILFVDDMEFEREQVKAVCPDVRTIDALEIQSLLEREDCQVPVTAESRERRRLYQVEHGRQTVAASFSGDHIEFLKYCGIRLTISRLTKATLVRAHELTQRTNQMNFSGTRYDQDVLRNLLNDPNMDSLILSCKDCFGDYGVIGFAVIDRREPRLIDLMFSCRIQGKHVEHAFLAYVIEQYRSVMHRDFYANYRKTLRNAPSGKVFEDLGMEEVETHEGISSLRFSLARPIPADSPVTIESVDFEEKQR